MPVAADYSSAVLNPARQPYPGQGGHKDQALLIVPTATVRNATATSTAIEVEGGELVEWVVELTAVSGTPTMDSILQVSVDGGSTWVTVAMFRQFVSTDIYNANPTAPVTGFTGAFAKAVWIPKPTGTNKTTQVRQTDTIGGSTSFTVNEYLRDFGYGQDRALNNL